MSYNNLLYLLVVIFLLSARPIPEHVDLPFWQAALLFIGKFAFFYFMCRRFFSASRVYQVRKYLQAEKHLTFLAIGFLAMDIYLLDCLYYFSLLPFAAAVPTLARFVGLLLFFTYLATIWYAAAIRSMSIFGRVTKTRQFITENIRSNLPIVLPWLFISLLLDVLNLLPIPAVRAFMDSGSGEIVILAVFFLFIALVFPPILLRIWGCEPMAPGYMRGQLDSFCRKLNLRYQDIMIWPLFGGQMVTAGVVGFIARFRYILVTPVLLSNLTAEEIDAVLAHEIGHVKRYHMQLYLVVLVGFSVILNPVIELTLYGALQGDWFYELADWMGVTGGDLLDFFLPASLLVLLVLFLRFVFAFFMRNFERQADLYAFESLGNGAAISAALEKVALLSGDIRDLPSWHHFGISQRVDFLAACDKKPELAKKHHRKVYRALGAYCLLIVISAVLHFTLPDDFVENAVNERVIVKLEEEAARASDNYQIYWALGDIQYRRGAYGEAIESYERSLELAPQNPEVLNNLAWLLLTSEDSQFINVDYGAILASKAAALKPAPHILDTLAHAYWLQGEKELALEVEAKALALARPEDKKIYADQLKKWQKELAGSSIESLQF